MIQVGATDEAHEVVVAHLRGSDQNERVILLRSVLAIALARFGEAITEGCGELAADDGLNAILRGFLGKFQCAEQVVGVGDADGGGVMAIACAMTLPTWSAPSSSE